MRLIKRHHDAGIALWLVIVLMLLSLSLLVAALVLYTDAKDKERLQKALHNTSVDNPGLAQRLQQEIEDVKVKMKDAVIPTGHTMSSAEKMPAGSATELARTIRDKYWSVEELNSYPRSPVPAAFKAQLEEIRRKKGYAPPAPLTADQVTAFNESRMTSEIFRRLQDQCILAGARVLHYKNISEQLAMKEVWAKKRTQTKIDLKPTIPIRKRDDRPLHKRRSEYGGSDSPGTTRAEDSAVSCLHSSAIYVTIW